MNKIDINTKFNMELNDFQSLSLVKVQERLGNLTGRSVILPEELSMLSSLYYECNDELLKLYEKYEQHSSYIEPSILSFSVMEYMHSASSLIISLTNSLSQKY